MTRPAAIALTVLLAPGAITACALRSGGGAAAADGATLYRRSCAACHRLKAPAEHDAETWRRAVERFGTHLSAEERRAISDYLAADARR